MPFRSVTVRSFSTRYPYVMLNLRLSSKALAATHVRQERISCQYMLSKPLLGRNHDCDSRVCHWLGIPYYDGASIAEFIATSLRFAFVFVSSCLSPPVLSRADKSNVVVTGKKLVRSIAMIGLVCVRYPQTTYSQARFAVGHSCRNTHWYVSPLQDQLLRLFSCFTKALVSVCE